MPTDKDRAIERARQILRDGNLGIALVPSESMLLAREYLRELGLLPEQRQAVHTVGQSFVRAEDVPGDQPPTQPALPPLVHDLTDHP